MGVAGQVWATRFLCERVDDEFFWEVNGSPCKQSTYAEVPEMVPQNF